MLSHYEIFPLFMLSSFVSVHKMLSQLSLFGPHSQLLSWSAKVSTHWEEPQSQPPFLHPLVTPLKDLSSSVIWGTNMRHKAARTEVTLPGKPN